MSAHCRNGTHQWGEFPAGLGCYHCPAFVTRPRAVQHIDPHPTGLLPLVAG